VPAESALPPILEAFEHDLARAMHRQATQAPRPARRARTALGLTAATALATAAILAVVLVGNGSDATTTALAEAANAALHQPPLLPREDQYLYVRTVGLEPTGMSTRQGVSVTAVERVVYESWRSALRPSLRRGRIVAIRFASRADARLWRSNHGDLVGRIRTERGPASGFYLTFPISGEPLTRKQVLVLPSDPHKLLAATLGRMPGAAAWLASLTAPGRTTTYTSTYSSETGPLTAAQQRQGLHNDFAYASIAFASIAEAFEQATLPARVRAGLYRALALIPGVRYVGIRPDLAGRRGVELAFDDLAHLIRDELIFDPATSALLGERQITTAPNVGFGKGAVLEDVAYLDQAVTSTTTIPSKQEAVR